MSSYVVDEIPVKSVVASKSQSRQRKVMDDIDELANNIRVFGLIHPVTVFEKDGKYELIAGQRRFLAVQKLGWKTIPAHVVPEPEDPIKAKAYSFSETFMRTDMVEQDLIEACTFFYNTYGNMALVATELGLPYPKVRKYVKMAQLPESLKKKVQDGTISFDRALKAVEFSTDENLNVDEEKSLELAIELQKMTGSQVKQVGELVRAEPSATVSELVEAGAKPPKIRELRIELHTSGYKSLSKYSKDTKATSESEAAVELLLEALSNKGYYEEEE